MKEVQGKVREGGKRVKYGDEGVGSLFLGRRSYLE